MDIVSWTFQNKEVNQQEPLYIDSSDPTRFLTAKDTQTLVRKLVSGFKHNGLEKGDCVCVVSFNDIHYTSLFLGIIGAGGCFSGANPGYTVQELIHHVRITEAKFLLASRKTLDISIAAAEKCGIPRSRVFVLDFQDEAVPEGYQSWNMLLGCGERNWFEVKDPDNTPAAYSSTSGTSGLPKAAVIPHSYFVSQGGYQDLISVPEYKVSNLIAIPPFHAFTIPLQHALPLRQGTPTYIMPRFEGQGFIDSLEKFSITHTVMVPPILMALSKCSQEEKLKSLRRIYIGGSCATDSMQQQMYAKLSPKARIEQVYGMTEVGWATNWHDPNLECTGSVGRQIPGYELRLIDSDGSVVEEDGVTGEIQIHAPHPMKGYLNNPAATAEAFSHDGWVRTGDIGYVREGRWYVIDRTKDLIKVRGWQVSPAEIEASLLEHDSIIDAAVIGIPAHDGSGEVPVAYVVRKAQIQLKEQDVKSFLGARLARYKDVDQVKFVEKIPRNPTGKILRRVLRDSRTAQPLSSDQETASAYSKAIKDLDKYQKEREHSKTHRRTQSLDDQRPAPRMRTASLTDASTIEDSGPTTPPSTAEAVAEPKKSRSSKKRKAESQLSSSVKRRSARLADIRGRAAPEC